MDSLVYIYIYLIRNQTNLMQGYRLDFMTQSDRWKGAAATIVEDLGSVVWGAIWEIDLSHLESLDK